MAAMTIGQLVSNLLRRIGININPTSVPYSGNGLNALRFPDVTWNVAKFVTLTIIEASSQRRWNFNQLTSSLNHVLRNLLITAKNQGCLRALQVINSYLGSLRLIYGPSTIVGRALNATMASLRAYDC